ALMVPAFIFRKRIMNKINKERNPYELEGDAVLKRDFRKHVEGIELDNVPTAFQKLSVKRYQTDKMAALRPFNRDKNRSFDICPFDKMRVKLSNTGTKGSDYINAS
ncbi:unnamed protein product, partial [Meganyctiphanes norvegica]